MDSFRPKDLKLALREPKPAVPVSMELVGTLMKAKGKMLRSSYSRRQGSGSKSLRPGQMLEAIQKKLQGQKAEFAEQALLRGA